MSTPRLGTGMYSPRVAARIARITHQSFQAWAKANLLHPTLITIGRRTEATYTYKDLLLIRLIVRLKDQGAKPKQIRTALNTIAVMTDGDWDAWMKSRIVFADGVIVVSLSDKPEWNPIAASLGPQRMAVIFFPELIQELKDELVPPEQFPFVEVDPEVLGGTPVVKGTRVSTRAVALVKESGVDPLTAYPDLTQEQVSNAEAYEEFLEAA